MKALTRALLIVATAGLAVQSAHAQGVRADFDGDGKADILFSNATTNENRAYFMDGKAIRYEGFMPHVPDPNWKIVGHGDFNGDGRADLLWRNTSTGENYVWLMDGVAIVGQGYLRTVADPNWLVVGVGDFNGDSKADVLWRNAATGENYIQLLNGIAVASEGYIRTVPVGWGIAGIGDFNGDGRSDILWRNAATGANYIYPMNGFAILGTEGHIRSVAGTYWQVVAVADFNGDGRADILWRQVSTGENYLYPMNGLTILGGEGYIRPVTDLAWRIVATDDYDGDGKADIVWRNASTGASYLYPMNGTTIKPTEGPINTVTSLTWRSTPAPAIATFAWDAVTAANLSGYRLYYGTAPGTYFQLPGQGLSVGNVTTFAMAGLSRGTRYYFAVTAHDNAGIESSYSNVVLKDVQ
jgi:hypothetical protein